jgi:LmbE family N-acetylglucosaminyl deacetylase
MRRELRFEMSVRGLSVATALSALLLLGLSLRLSVARAEAPLPSTDRLMVVVAHEDDDIMVSIPDLTGVLREHRAVQLVYLTSGDNGFTCNAYTMGREQGAKAVQAKLAGVPNSWIDEERLVRGKRVRFSRLAGTSTSMAFLGLPNPKMFSQDPPEGALQRLWLRQLTSVSTVPFDGRSGLDSYTREELIEVLRTLMSDFQARDLRVLDASQQQLPIYPFEHVDHMGSAMFATAAFMRYGAANAITFYPLYSVIAKPANLSAADTKLRTDVWALYKGYDPKACDTGLTTICGAAALCDPSLVYDPLWPRSYPEDVLRSTDTLIRTPLGLCLEAVGTSLTTRFCDPQRSGQHWAIPRGGSVRNVGTGQCLAAASASNGTQIALATCARSPSQQFYLTTQKQLRSPDATCAREGFGALAVSDCAIDLLQTGFALR